MSLESDMWLYFILLISVSTAKYDDENRYKPDHEISKEDTIFCSACVFVSRIVKLYLRPVATAAEMMCMTLNLGRECGGTTKRLLGALETGGERRTCSLIHLCSGNENPLEVPLALRNVTDKLQSIFVYLFNVTKGTKKRLADSIKKATSGVNRFLDGSKNVAEQLINVLPVFSDSMSRVTDSARNIFGSVGENFGTGVDSIFGHRFFSNAKNMMRSPTTSDVKSIKDYLESLEIPLPPNASEIEKSFYYLAQEIKEKTIKAIEEAEEENENENEKEKMEEKEEDSVEW